MDLFIILIAGIAFGLVWGWAARERHAMRQLDKLLSTVDMEEGEELIPIIIEKQEHMLFAYGKEDNSFMAQGADRSQLEKNLLHRYPGKRFAASPENLKQIGFDK
jgi:hypothetical protein